MQSEPFPFPMALVRRILYPEDSYNQTATSDCFSNCHGDPILCSSCISPAAIPEGYLPKTFFPPPPTAPWVDVNMTTPIMSHKTNRHLTLIALVVSSVLAAFFLLVTYYVLFLRFRTHLRRRREAAAMINTPGGPGPSPDEDEGDGFDPNGGVHHVWFIRTVGLEQPMIDSITVCPYKRGDGLIESTDCPVCLSEFEDGELVRLLPKCCHAFHIPCIDTWLRAHLNCPLCRAPIISPTLPPAAAPVEAAASSTAAAATTASSPAPAGGSDLAVPAATAVGSESADTDRRTDSLVGDEEHMSQPLRTTIFTVPEDREESGTVFGDSSSGSGNNNPPAPRAASLSIAEFGFRVQSDLGGSGGRRQPRNDEEWVTIDLGPDRGIQPVRRSVSMDLSAMGTLFHREEEEEEDAEDHDSTRKANLPPCLLLPSTPAIVRMMKLGRDPKGGNNNNLHKDVVIGMERCSSTNSGGFILSRLARGRTRSHASILPL